VTLYLDSEYVRKGITEWIHGWKASGLAHSGQSSPSRTWTCGRSWTLWWQASGHRIDLALGARAQR
jgi:ribonuclease HI